MSLQEEFAGVVATEGSVESLRGRMSEAEMQVENLFESLLAQSFAAG
jgi:hypothetical protein